MSDDALEAVSAALEVTDGRVTMTARSDARLLVDVPEETPFARAQTHATLRVSGPDFEATVEFDAYDVDALLHALEVDTDR